MHHSPRECNVLADALAKNSHLSRDKLYVNDNQLPIECKLRWIHCLAFANHQKIRNDKFAFFLEHWFIEVYMITLT